MSMDHSTVWHLMSSSRKRGELDPVPRGTWRRVLRFAKPYRRELLIFLAIITGSALIGVITPVLAGRVVNDITRHSQAQLEV